ncbi:MAG: hypothetical protein AB7G11_10140 [Phycisphaerales bacterium]
MRQDPHNPGSSTQPRAHHRIGRRWRFATVAVLLAAFGLLLWVKLRIAVSIPRTVIAEPRRVDPMTNAGSAPLHSAAADPRPHSPAP